MGCWPGRWQDGSVWGPRGGAQRSFAVGCRGTILSKVSAFSVVIPDSLLAFPGICLHLCPAGGARTRLIRQCPRVSQDADQQEEGKGSFPSRGSPFSPGARLGPQVR